jgi:ADP-ribose pyrophosphatase
MVMRILNQREIFAGRIITLSLDEIAIAEQTLEMECVRHPGGAAVVPLLPDGTVVMIEQYRYAVGTPLWEIPAGRLDNGENPRDCALRELEEEAGYKAMRIEKLADIYSAPAYCTEIISVFLATELLPGIQHLEADECIRVVTLPLVDALNKVLTTGVSDAKTLVGLLLARQYIASTGLTDRPLD